MPRDVGFRLQSLLGKSAPGLAHPVRVGCSDLVCEGGGGVYDGNAQEAKIQERVPIAGSELSLRFRGLKPTSGGSGTDCDQKRLAGDKLSTPRRDARMRARHSPNVDRAVGPQASTACRLIRLAPCSTTLRPGILAGDSTIHPTTSTGIRQADICSFPSRIDNMLTARVEQGHVLPCTGTCKMDILEVLRGLSMWTCEAKMDSHGYSGARPGTPRRRQVLFQIQDRPISESAH
jgi:hypothetical protein